MKNQKGYTITELLFSIVALLGAIGWIINIAKLVSAISEPITLMLILRVVGIIIFPLGMILGYL